MSKTRITYIANTIGKSGGASLSAIDVLFCLCCSGDTVTVLSHDPRISLPSPTLGRIVTDPLWVRIKKRVPFPDRTGSGLAKNIARWAVRGIEDIFLTSGQRLARRTLGDIVFVNTLGGHDICVKACPKTEGHRVLIVRESPILYKNIGSGETLEWATAAMNTYSSLVFVSKNVMELWRPFGVLEGKKLFYIPNCCNEEEVRALEAQDRLAVRKELGFRLGSFVAVCIAAVRERKGQGVLLDYFSEIRAAVPNLDLYLVGPARDAWSDGLRKKFRMDGHGNHVKFMGYRKDAMKFLYAADLLVFPSLTEAMPRVVLEAMALKTPVIASDVGGIPELVEDGLSGLLFSQSEPEKLVDLFREIAKSREKRLEFAEQGYRRYWANFSRNHQLKRYADLLNELRN